MLSIAMRSDWQYLMRHTKDGPERDNGERQRGAAARGHESGGRGRDYYTAGADEHGEPPGRWWGRGAESLGLRGNATSDVMEKLYGNLTDPNTGEALGSRPREYASYEERLAALLDKEPDATPERRAELELAAHKSHREARHYADLTFSPPKSWSVLHAALEHAGRHDEAEAVWDAWEEGVHAGLEYLMDEVGYSRAGYHGAKVAGRTSGKWVDAHDYIVSVWRHHTSRDGDPQIHIHAAVPNRVRSDDGVWRTLDSNALWGARAAAGALSERVAEERLVATLGVEVRTRPDGKAREIVGVTQEDRDLFSSRRRAITPGVADLIAAYEAKHGKAPSRYVQRLMAEHVTLKTRNRKPDKTPSREELLSTWERSIRSQLGRSLDDVLRAVGIDSERAEHADGFSRDRVIAQAIADVEATKAVWNRHDLVAAIVRHLPEELGGLTGEQVRTLVAQLTDEALTPAIDREIITLTVPELTPVPDELRRADGRSQFEPHRPERYATKAQLEREESLLATARQTGAPQVEEERVEELLENTELGDDQRAAVAGLLGSGKRLEVLVGPAGTGKSYTVGTLVEMWKEAFGTGVFGIAVSQNAVGVLRDEGIKRGANVTQFLNWHDKLARGELLRSYREQCALREREIPEAYREKYRESCELREREILDKYALHKGDLLVIDEASTISTVDLTRVVQIANDAGAKVLVTGDPNQLGAVGVGGAMELLVDRVGAVRLSEVRRFAAQWEREASLRLREGDTGALLEYDRHGRLVGGSKEQMTHAALNGFLGDYLAGKRSLLLADDNETAAELSSTVREELVRLGRVEERGMVLHNDTVAGAGDMIQTRQNEYRMRDPLTDSDFIVVNREVWRVDGTDPLGNRWLTVRRDLGRDERGEQRWGTTRHLPAEYVREHVELAYASTVHAAEGRTVDTGHALVGEGADLPAVYVEGTRGVDSNVLYVITGGTDEHYLTRLSEILERPPGERSATHILGEEFNAVDHLGRLGPVWSTLIGDDAAERYRGLLVTTLGEERAAGVAEDEASGPLYRLLRSAELDGHDVARLVAHAVSQRELDSADSVAQVLHHRVERDLSRMGAADSEAAGFAMRYRELLTSTLGEEQATLVAQDEASRSLYRLLHSAERDGHDVTRLLSGAVHRRELDSAESIAKVLHYRVERELREATPSVPPERAAETVEAEPTEDAAKREAERFVLRTYQSRTPVMASLPTAVSDYVRRLAESMDERAAYLGTQAAAAPPAWAEKLGPVPADPIARLEWEERAGAVAAYREQFGFDSETEEIGARPGAGNPERRVAWDQAADALGVRDVEREMAGHTVGDLANLIDRYRREEAWLPPNVNDRLRTAHIAAREAEGSVARVRARFEAAYHKDAARIDLAERLGQAEALAVRMRERAEQLEEIAQVRERAVASVADVYERARAAGEELRHRGIDPETLRRDDTERETEAQRERATAHDGQRAEPDRVPERGAEDVERDVATSDDAPVGRESERPEPDGAVEERVAEPAAEVVADQVGRDRIADLAVAWRAAEQLAAEREAGAERVDEGDAGDERRDEVAGPSWPDAPLMRSHVTAEEEVGTPSADARAADEELERRGIDLETLRRDDAGRDAEDAREPEPEVREDEEHARASDHAAAEREAEHPVPDPRIDEPVAEVAAGAADRDRIAELARIWRAAEAFPAEREALPERADEIHVDGDDQSEMAAPSWPDVPLDRSSITAREEMDAPSSDARVADEELARRDIDPETLRRGEAEREAEPARDGADGREVEPDGAREGEERDVTVDADDNAGAKREAERPVPEPRSDESVPEARRADDDRARIAELGKAWRAAEQLSAAHQAETERDEGVDIETVRDDAMESPAEPERTRVAAEHETERSPQVEEPAPEPARTDVGGEDARRLATAWLAAQREATAERTEATTAASRDDHRPREEGRSEPAAEPTLDPGKVWRQVTAHERYEVETEQARARGAERPAPIREPEPERTSPVAERPHEAEVEDQVPEPAEETAAEREEAQLAEDLARARAAAERLAERHEATIDRDISAEIDAALAAERARQAEEARRAEQQRPPPQAERDDGIEMGM